MRLSVPTLLVVIIVYSVLFGVIFFFLDKYLDMRVVSYSVDMTRQAMNLLNNILESSSEEGLLVVDKRKIRDILYVKDIPEYDYKLTIEGEGQTLYTFQKNINTFDLTSGCYLPYQVMKGYAELPIVIKEGNTKKPGKAKLELVRTPISELAFWISQGSLRVKRGFDKEVVKQINVESKSLYLKGDEICMDNACKSFTSYGLSINLCDHQNRCKGYGGCETLELTVNGTGIFVKKVKGNE